MTPLNLGIELDAGADFNLVIGIFGDSGPIDITGYSFKSEMRSTTETDSPVIAEFQFQTLNQTTNMGQVQWFLSVADDEESAITTSVSTALSKWRLTTPFVFDVKMQDTSGTITRIIQGLMYVSPEATQETFT